MAYEIEKNVALPKRRGGPGLAPKYPWKQMKVGDSFFLPGKPGLRAAGSSWNKSHPETEFISRVVDGGIRFWRVK